jgi:hypothetical protein
MKMEFSAPERKKIGLHLIIFSLFTIILINFLHFSALESYYYWIYWWFDILMHFLGGFWVGISSIWLLFVLLFVKGKPATSKNVLLFSLLSVLLVGILWEVFEFFTWNTFDEPNFFTDTSADIFFDLIGGFVASLYSIFSFVNKKIKI